MSPSRAYTLYAMTDAFDDPDTFGSDYEGNRCSRELLLVLRRKAARRKKRDVGQPGPTGPAAGSTKRGR
eukprot:14303936-Alexandrium_andersonii.AAC.1